MGIIASYKYLSDKNLNDKNINDKNLNELKDFYREKDETMAWTNYSSIA